jgi:hypothetical protein
VRVLPAGAVFLWAATAAAAPIDWLQFDFDSRHSGNNPQETVIHPGNVATMHLVPGYPVSLGTLVAGADTEDGAPALLTDVSTPSGTRNVLFLTTKNGRIMAIDAAAGTLVWTQRPATGPNYTTSSPAIDPNRQFVYSYGLQGKVHKYQVGDGTEITTGGWPQTATLKPSVEKGSSALSFATAASGTTYLYCANGGYPGDAGDYQGHVTTINLTDGTQKVFNVSCSDLASHFVLNGTEGVNDCPNHPQNAIWARPGVVYDAVSDRIYMATGNGDYDANQSTGDTHEWGDTVFALHADATGSAGRPLDSYTPTNFQALQDADADLGSTNPVLLPMPAGSLYPHVAAQSGKDGMIRLVNLDDMSGQGGPGHTGGELQLTGVLQGGEVLSAPAVWVDPQTSTTWMFVTNDNGISALSVGLATGVPVLALGWQDNTVGGRTSPIVANGILYYETSGGVVAYGPTDGTVLWSQNAVTFGATHWESPIVVNGRIYFTDESAQLWAYEPAPPALHYFTVAPCRLVDTRRPNGTWGGPALVGGGAVRAFPVAGQCGVDPGAVAVAVNATIAGPTNGGDIRLFPAGPSPSVSTLNFNAGRTRANNAIVSLTGSPVGSIAVQSDLFPGTTNFLLDVVGYFK